MLTKIIGLIQAWDDSQKQKAIFAPDERLFAIEAEGYQDCIASQFVLRVTDDPVEVSRGTLLEIRAALLIVEGISGVDVRINGAVSGDGNPLFREIRPPFDNEDAADDRPRAYYLETSTDFNALIPFVITHGDPDNEDADPVTVRYILIGDSTDS